MSWLNYNQDEVRYFHPEFESAANEALRVAGLEGAYEWIHHIRTPGSTIIPDFVLQRKAGHQWILAFEIKRRPEGVQSTRNQIQAKGYAETNQHLYPPTAPKYFAISNLETSILFALNGNRPPRECRIQNGVFVSGNFSTDSKMNHRARFINDLAQMLSIVVNIMNPTFETVWPSILSEFLAFVTNLPDSPEITIAEPSTPSWNIVREFFAGSLSLDSARIFMLRCLMLEYLRGSLMKHSHPYVGRLYPLNPNYIPASVANAVDALRQIDFHVMFDKLAADLYRNLSVTSIMYQLRQYVSAITAPNRRIVDLAITRIDSPELLDSVMSTIYPVETQDDSGKVTTDPDLATLLAYITITTPVNHVLDPCCGDGILLASAYDRLLDLGLDHHSAISAVGGIEADIIAAGLTCVRLALKQPASLSPTPAVAVKYGDMFANQDVVANADVILMNPPFKRYEAQDSKQVPQALREHYFQSIQQIDGKLPITTAGQANLFNFYVEFVAKAIPIGTRVGIILDNKWYHNRYGQALRTLLLQKFEIESIIEYPHSVFFAHWAIATSILIARKVLKVNPSHTVRFVRSKVDPRSVDIDMLVNAFHRNGTWPPDWTCQTKPQTELNAKDGWKSLFSNQLINDFRRTDWPTLETLFIRSRRGSLEKEGGGIGVLEFPFHRSNYGSRRLPMMPRRRYQTQKDRPLTHHENVRLASLAERIPGDFRGKALKKADNPSHYELTIEDVEKHQTLEPPSLARYYDLFLDDRTPWTPYHEAALTEMRFQAEVNAFITEIENVVNLTTNTLPKEELWNALREPIAGELIIPRKTREGHRVHINPFAFNLDERQVRISSNFITYGGCIAEDISTDLDRPTSVRLIAAFLVSSFGQLQFEMEGYNREGMLALEKNQLQRIRIFDPRWIRPQKRQAILRAFSQLPYPIQADRLSYAHSERNELDRLFAEEINARFAMFDLMALLEETHAALDEWLTARQP